MFTSNAHHTLCSPHRLHFLNARTSSRLPPVVFWLTIKYVASRSGKCESSGEGLRYVMAELDVGDDSDDVLARFLPPVAAWFREALGEPTPAQRQGWPAIAAGRNTLIVAPTGSGKTLAAFLAALDLLWRTPRREAGVRILYISPLKALNQDIRRNLEIPLAGILERSRDCGPPLGPLQSAVRSGDSSASDRARLVRKPPDILITTPESLHLMLTSRAREILRGVSHVIIDEIHAVCGNKRGVFLALLLERLEAICKASFLRVGLSATQRPLAEVAHYLGGRRCIVTQPGERRFEARPVTIINAGRRKNMDLQVIWPGPDESQFLGPPGTIWPAIEERIVSLIDGHRSTLVFTNSRRTVERLTSRINEAIAAVEPIEAEPGLEPENLRAWFRAHHGSLSLEERRTTEEELKSGALKGVVSTASLELGIDMGHIDLVCQVESPGNIARGLQRVGRAGHVVHGVSKGRLIAKTAGDLLETAALRARDGRGPHRAIARAAWLSGRPGPAGGGMRGDGPLGRAGPVRSGAPRLSF